MGEIQSVGDFAGPAVHSHFAAVGEAPSVLGAAGHSMSEHASVADVGAEHGELALGNAAMPAESVGMPAPAPSFAAMHPYAVNQQVRSFYVSDYLNQ